jgi:hypothetical protein
MVGVVAQPSWRTAQQNVTTAAKLASTADSVKPLKNQR